MAFGYRECEHEKIPSFDGKNFINGDLKIEVSSSVKIVNVREPVEKSRPVVQASLGMHVPGLTLPHVDPNDTSTVIAGSLYRFGRKIPRKFKMRKFRRFVQRWLKKNLTPLAPSADTSFENWIKNTPYTLARKNELRRKYLELNVTDYNLPEQYLKVMSFIKDETYLDWKHARAINSRTDEYKCVVGPIFQLISDQLFATDWFIKKVPIAQRPQVILDSIFRVGHKILTSDYTSFEAHFDKEVKEACEYELYSYMTQFLPDGEAFMTLIRRATSGINKIFFKLFDMTIEAKRMSGEMDTSLANGFSNLMFMLYMCEENGNTEVAGKIEGDDGIFSMIGDPPTAQQFADFGLSIKMVEFDQLNHASFCGMVFDLDDRTNVTDPIAELVSFGWTTARYAKSGNKVHMNLLRCKALSLAYQYPACPILSKLAYKVCQLTAGYDSLRFLNKQGNSAFNQYEMDLIMKSHLYFDKNGLLKQPGQNTRLLVEQLYGVTVSEQYAIEQYIDEMTAVAPIACAEIFNHAPSAWVEYSSRYVADLNYKDSFTTLLNQWPSIRPPAVFK